MTIIFIVLQKMLAKKMVFHPIKKNQVYLCLISSINENKRSTWFFLQSFQSILFDKRIIPLWSSFTMFLAVRRIRQRISNFVFHQFFNQTDCCNEKTSTNTKALGTKFSCISIQFTIKLLTTWFHKFPIWIFINVCIQSKRVLSFFYLPSFFCQNNQTMSWNKIGWRRFRLEIREIMKWAAQQYKDKLECRKNLVYTNLL